MTDRCILTVLLIHCRACDGPKACVQTFISNESRGVWSRHNFYLAVKRQPVNLFNILKVKIYAKNYFPNFNQTKERNPVHEVFAHVFLFQEKKKYGILDSGVWSSGQDDKRTSQLWGEVHHFASCYLNTNFVPLHTG